LIEVIQRLAPESEGHDIGFVHAADLRLICSACKKKFLRKRSDLILLRFAKISNVLVRFDHVASFIEYANHSVM